MNVDEKLKAFFEYIKKADNGDLTERDIADKARLPDGCSYDSWLNDIETYAANLPDDTPRVDAIKKNVPLARQALADGKTSDLRLFIHRLDEAYSDIRSNRLGKRGFTAETAGRHPAWYTRPLIKMCRALRQCHHTYTAEDMFNALPDQSGIPPIDSIRRNSLGELTIAACDDCNYHDKSMTMASFRKFCSKHRDEIGKKRLL